ncbi:MAG: sulfotransferase [Flavobacteriales bacterium]|nr:sulfotransferase [Flavobacteriales bacterium]
MGLLSRIRERIRQRRQQAHGAAALVRKQGILATRGFAVERSLIITGDPRGGTTWLMELLARSPGIAINWEPLHHDRGVVPASMHWGRRPAIPELDADPARAEVMQEILTYARSTAWTTRYLSEAQAASAQRVLTKFVRANLLLPWITARFQLVHRPILLLRHPVPTVLSQMKAFPHDDHHAARWSAPDQLFNEAYLAEEDYLNSLPPGLVRHVGVWCVRNLGTLRHARHGTSWMVVHYEDLVLDPATHLKRIAQEWHLDETAILASGHRQRSTTDFGNDLRSDPAEQVGKWLKTVDPRLLADIQAVLDHYDVRFYAAHVATPRHDPAS